MTPDQRKLIDLEFDQCVEQRRVLFLGGGWPGEGLKREHSLTAGGRWGQRADMSSFSPSSLRETSSWMLHLMHVLQTTLKHHQASGPPSWHSARPGPAQTSLQLLLGV